MRKTLLVLLGTVVLPSILLGVLALRKTSEQQIVLERQTASLYQRHTDALAEEARRIVAGEQQSFIEAVDSILAPDDSMEAARDFAGRLASRWPRARVGFAVSTAGVVLSPRSDAPTTPPEWVGFLAANRAFLSSRQPTELFQTPPGSLPQPNALKAARNVRPQEAFSPKSFARQDSKLNVMKSDFASAVSRGSSGTVARTAQSGVEIFFWQRSPRAPDVVFGAMLTPGELEHLWRERLPGRVPSVPDILLALLNERGEPVWVSRPGFSANWKLPFVATEVGEALPYWEAALYLVHPERFTESARSLTLSVGLLIALSLGAIAWGGIAVVRETRQQMTLVQKKTDFVSNVSHELKTPLTSIRLFADLLHQNRVAEPEKRAEYLHIIAREAERLTRLINNVLDFSRLEREKPPARREVVDLSPVVERIWSSEAERLRSLGFQVRWEAAEGPYRAPADPDAVAQILVNLLSNAEKYSPGVREVTLKTFFDRSRLYLSVSDRGLGVPPGQEEAIFEAFHRAHDSLSSGISGSGLGLALSRRLAESEGGSLTFERRPDGGSQFLLMLPTGESGAEP